MSKKYPNKVKVFNRFSGSLAIRIGWRNGKYLVNVSRRSPSAGEAFEIVGPSPYDMDLKRGAAIVDVIAAQAISMSRLRPDADRDGPAGDWMSYVVRRRR